MSCKEVRFLHSFWFWPWTVVNFQCWPSLHFGLCVANSIFTFGDSSEKDMESFVESHQVQLEWGDECYELVPNLFHDLQNCPLHPFHSLLFRALHFLFRGLHPFRFLLWGLCSHCNVSSRQPSGLRAQISFGGGTVIPDICHFFYTPWKFYTQKCVYLRHKLPHDKIALSTTVCKITPIV